MVPLFRIVIFYGVGFPILFFTRERERVHHSFIHHDYDLSDGSGNGDGGGGNGVGGSDDGDSSCCLQYQIHSSLELYLQSFLLIALVPD